MRSFLRRLTAPPAPTLPQTAAPRAEPVWEYVAPGGWAIGLWIEPTVGSVYIADGWGVTYSSIRLRRLDLATGIETASARTGTAVRCLLVEEDGHVIAASDSKLFRFDARTMQERERWDTRVPRFTNSIARVGHQLVMANGVDPKVTFFDLATGKVRRRDAPGQPLFLRHAERLLVVGGITSGGLAEVDAALGQVRSLAHTPPALHAWLSPTTGDIWLLAGVRLIIDATSAEMGKASSEVVRYATPAYEATETLPLPRPAFGVTGAASHLWASGDRDIRGDSYLMIVDLPPANPVVRAWTAPSGQKIYGIDAATGTVVTARQEKGKEQTRITCYRFDLTVG